MILVFKLKKHLKWQVEIGCILLLLKGVFLELYKWIEIRADKKFQEDIIKIIKNRRFVKLRKSKIQRVRQNMNTILLQALDITASIIPLFNQAVVVGSALIEIALEDTVLGAKLKDS